MRTYQFLGLFALSLISSTTASPELSQISRVENSLPALFGRQVGGGGGDPCVRLLLSTLDNPCGVK